MLELIYIDGILVFNGIEYSISNLEISSENVVYATIQNDIYLSVIALVANETIINGVLQTSAQMIIDTLSSNGQS
jgi:hypothetical protein